MPSILHHHKTQHWHSAVSCSIIISVIDDHALGWNAECALLCVQVYRAESFSSPADFNLVLTPADFQYNPRTWPMYPLHGKTVDNWPWSGGRVAYFAAAAGWLQLLGQPQQKWAASEWTHTLQSEHCPTLCPVCTSQPSTTAQANNHKAVFTLRSSSR